jgi:hypothetical protein
MNGQSLNGRNFTLNPVKKEISAIKTKKAAIRLRINLAIS